MAGNLMDRIALDRDLESSTDAVPLIEGIALVRWMAWYSAWRQLESGVAGRLFRYDYR